MPKVSTTSARSQQRPRQLKLFTGADLGPIEHGGDLNERRRKTQRPFSPDAGIHIVLKSSRARGHLSLLHRRNRSKVESLLQVHAKRTHVRIYRHANVGSHIHLLVKAPYREALDRFLRAISGLISRHVLKARKGSPAQGRLWDRIPYSRLIHWGREFRALCAYLAKNKLEACGWGGARLRFTSKGEAVIVMGASDYRPTGHRPGTPVLSPECGLYLNQRPQDRGARHPQRAYEAIWRLRSCTNAVKPPAEGVRSKG